MAAAIGAHAAQSLGRRVLVLTVDPAKRLATALGLDLNSSDERVVPLEHAKGTMAAAVIDSKKIFDEFIRSHAARSEVVERITRNRLYEQLSTTLSGSQEFTALERLLQAYESGKFDLIILDTPPTKHAMDFLTAPHRISALFQDSVMKWFMNPDAESKSFIAGLIGRGTRMALKSLEVLTGGAFIEELVDFFSAIRSIQKVLRERSERVLELLKSPRTSFVVVTSFDEAKLLEARYLQEELSHLRYHLKAVIINRAFPLGVPSDIQAVPEGMSPGSYVKVLNFHRLFREYHAIRYNLYEKFCRGLKSSIAVLRVPEYQVDVHGLSDLQELGKVLGGKEQGS